VRKVLLKLFLLSIILSQVLLLISCSPSQTVLQTAIAGTQTALPTNTPIYTATEIFTATSTEEPPTSTPAPLPTIEPTSTPSYKQLSSIFSPVRVSNICEFQVYEIKFARKILPPNTSGYYTYYEVKSSGETFLDIVITIKNLDTIIKSVDDLVSVNVLYDNQYTYNSSPIVVDSDGSFTYALISGVQPLSSKVAHYLVTVPNEVQNNSKSLIIIFNVGDIEYHYRYR